MLSTATRRIARSGLLVGLVCSLSISLAGAAVPKQDEAFLDHKAFFRPELYISSTQVPLADIIGQLPNRAALEAFTATRAADGSAFHVFIDPRSGAAVNVMGAVPLIPGSGVGNDVTLESLGASLGRTVEAVDQAAVAEAALAYVRANSQVLGIDASQLGAVVASQVSDELWQISIPQTISGIPVRYGRVAASISHGNLVTIGTETWGNVSRMAPASVTAKQAIEAGFVYVEGRTGHDEITRQPALEIIPFAPPAFQSGEAFAGQVGKGYGHYLVWTFEFTRPPELARWEVMVDAHSGEVLALQDTNQYVERGFTGGVYPLTDTGICPDADHCGTMQSGWPMPFANTGFAAPNNFTNSAGIYNYTSGTATTTLAGRFVRMVDSCGAVSESSATGAINLGGTNNQHDCTSGGSSAGNTPASRSGFYELNKLAEQARGYLPTNSWLNAQLTANMNLNQTCNAFWGGGTVNFYRSGGGCRNTGEIAAVFDHEWGHGMDDNDAAGALSNSSEGYADIASIYRLEASCVGHGFFQTLDDGCGTTPDGTGFNTNEHQNGGSHCDTDCSGVRDADWAKHIPSTPDTPANFTCSACLTGTGPCGRQVHCAAAPTRQAAWDFVTRDLTAAPFSLDSQSAFIVGNKVFYHGSGNIGAWHSCTCPSTSAGCATANGYIQWLTADDDNGSLNDGTPHMTALFNAYNRHGIACATPAAQNSGCAGGPTAAATLSVSGGNFSASLSWNSVAGATRYWVFRSEGHAGCNFGKTLIAEVTGLSFTDTQVTNGRTYYYNVVAAGASGACYGRASNCVNVTPSSTPDYSVACAPSSLSIQQGNSGNTTCTVTSSGGFASAVGLSCANLTAGASCSFNPTSVTPPANGSVNSTLTVSTGTAATGTTTFQVVGTSGATTRSANVGLTVTPAPTPDFSVAANPTNVSVTQGGASAGTTITVSSTNGFSSAVTLSTSTLPSGVSAVFGTNPVTPPANGSATSSLTFSASGTAATGTFPITVTGTSGATSRTATVNLTVNPVGGAPDLTATFDAARQAPSCGTTVGRSCDTGTALVLGRANLGPEPNQPNTIADSCADGTAGTFHSDESNDRIRVFTTDGTAFAPGKTVTIQATVWAWTTPSQDAADFYFAANAASPTWTLIGSVVPSAAGAQTLSVNYTLPAGAMQAVRVQFRYQSTSAACAAGTFNDRDDLVFAVTSTPVTTVFSDNFETATGWVTNPNGTDTATTGQWERGDPEATTDGGARQLGTTTSGVNDLVTARLAGASAGANDIDGGVTTIHSPTIALPATGTLSLSFQYYLAHSSNSSNLDFFRAFVVVGSTSTQVFQSLGAASNRNGAWTPVSVSLNAFAGQTVRIRFEAADASTASLVEAGVDDVVITQQ